MTDPLTFEAIAAEWLKQRVSWNLSQDAKLFQDAGRVIYASAEWGPPVPYGPAPREKGHNYGYRSTKGDDAAIDAIPEVQGWPEYSALLKAINRIDGQWESVGCEKCYFDVEPSPENEAPVTTYLGSYTNVMFSEPTRNTPENQMTLAAAIGQSLKGCERWWSQTELGIERMRRLDGVNHPWCLNVKIHGYGRDRDEARKMWGISADIVAEAFASQLMPVE